MSPLKNIYNTGLIYRCTLMMLLQAMTSMCSAAVTTTADATFLTIPALGRTAQLGFLYDERTDTFRPISVFSKPIPPDVIIESLNTDVATETQVTNTYAEKIQLFEIGLNAAVNVLAGNTKVRGTASILKQENKDNSFAQQGTLLRTHHTVEGNLQVFYNDLRPFFNLHLLQHKDATHIVSGILWGSRISVTLRTTASTPSVDAEELNDTIYDELQKIKRGPLNFKETIKNLNYTIDVKSDIPLPSPAPTTTQGVEILLTKFPQLINDTNGGKGVPLEFTLTPLSELRTHLDVQTIINNPVQKIKDSTLRSLSNIFDNIWYSEQRIHALYQETYFQVNCLSLETRDEIADLRTNFLKYKKHFADHLKEILVDVRSGSKPTSALTDFVDEFKRSNFSSRSVKHRIREYREIFQKVAFCETIQTSYSDIEYFGSRQNLILRISENSERPIYILFVKTDFKNNNPVKYTEDLNIFLKTLYVPSNKLFIVDCDSGYAFCSNLTQTEIHEYKKGKLTTTDFKQDAEIEDNDVRKEISNLIKNFTILQTVTEKHTKEEPADNCTSNPCQNNGICSSSQVNSFTCTCPPGFTGPTCIENVNECESRENPCENDGRCIDEVGGFTCVCHPSFAGQKCQEKLDPCKNIECQNGASCVVLSNYLKFACSCLTGFNGTFCELDIDDCSLNTLCQNGGTCVDGINSYSCVCAEGYEGQDCATVTNNCGHSSDACLNGGTCVNGNNSYSCVCVDQFTGDICENLNECRYPGTCSPPRYAGNCHRCRDGFVKDSEDNSRCKYANGNVSLIISSHTDIRMISLESQNTTDTIQSKDHVFGIDLNLQTNTIFWFSSSDKTIYRAPISTNSQKQSIYHDSSSAIYGLAVDWIYHHVYMADSARKEIWVTNFNGTMGKVIVKDGIQLPYSIAVNPLNGWMYWSDRGTHRIERAGLDGSRREVILSTNIKDPHGLVLDFVDSRLYWSQGYTPSSIWSSDFNGLDRKLIFNANPTQFSPSLLWKIATFDKYVYFIEWHSKKIYKANKCNGDELGMNYKSINDSNLRDIKILDATKQPYGENLCSKRIGRCSRFCFPVPSVGNGSVPVSTTSCACPDGQRLLADQQGCI